MEQVRKNEQNKLSRGLRRYFKRSKHLLRKPMEALSSEEQERLALMFEIAPRLADAYRLKNEFLAVMHSESSTVGKQRLLDWHLIQDRVGVLSPGAVFSVHRCRKGSDF